MDNNSDDEQFHLLVDAVKDYGIYMMDRQGVITTWNAGAERIKGYTAAEVIGRNYSMFFTPEDREAGVPARSLRRAESEGRYSTQGVRVRKDGTRFYADVLVTAVHKPGEGLVGFAKITRDVTERHRYEEELRRRVDELAEADRRKDEFIAMLGHELRNPLAPIFTGLTILQRVAQVPPAGARALQSIERQLKLMARLVDDLLQISRMTRGKIELRREAARLDAIIEQAVEIAAPLFEERGQRLDVHGKEPLDIVCDPQRIIQVVSNILNNASKYTPRGGRASLAVEKVGESAVITVVDTGIGIRREMLERIFDVFVQDQRAPGTEMQGGLGIGLALARTVVAMHGGTIRAESEGEGRGSRFQIVLPLASTSDHEAPVPGVTSQFRVLVVDDNLDAAAMIADLLEIEGYVVESANGGVEALKKAETFHPHMILLDLLMPDLTGYEVIKRVRKHPGGPVVVAVTGHGSDADRRKVREAGFDAHIVKPVVGEAVLAAVRRFLHGRTIP
jgi:PAS domain S-box-containing protein